MAQEKILDEIIEVIDYMAQDTDTFINGSGDVIWSGNSTIDGTSTVTSTKLIRAKIKKLKRMNAKINNRFQLHFSNLAQKIKPITDIKLD